MPKYQVQIKIKGDLIVEVEALDLDDAYLKAEVKVDDLPEFWPDFVEVRYVSEVTS